MAVNMHTSQFIPNDQMGAAQYNAWLDVMKAMSVGDKKLVGELFPALAANAELVCLDSGNEHMTFDLIFEGVCVTRLFLAPDMSIISTGGV